MKEEGYEFATVCVTTENNKKKDKYVVDSGCTFHIYPFKNYFIEYHEFDGGRIEIGNNFMCKIIRTSNVSL